ncbi:polysaccharide deacetylase family protein [Modestobacter sp. I12A-02628]|uniref:Polysaccharide deacetylase family protein n=1 Tax=Goekera deserti TaxID=2497753 RepID=A0A7K3WC95_9ACTN|nr:polysaccharide deacetylase family protein [Goekera deserti]MPQ98847.1 polysaccharide deacetylase family protein [Goekera deserti]NDI49654.1 polysaccharide deacetylase family protein [Goekera deserti]NEL53153.1 polysaccharide deacetylase family protein [Goekera deserti]
MRPSRRSFLLGAGSAAAGLAVGASGLLPGAEAAEEQFTVAQRRHLQASAAAAQGMSVARLGTHRVVWSMPVSRPVAALTFDDGPTPEYTGAVLDALDRAGVTATFNVMGWNAARHPGLLREVVAAGHELGNHTWTHQDLTYLSAAETREQLIRCRDEVAAVVGAPLTCFRPPRGQVTGQALQVAAELGYDTYIWSCTRGPDELDSVDAIAAYLGSTVDAGDVVCLHDGIGRGTFSPTARFARDLAHRRDLEVAALPEALMRIADRGISLVSATQMLALSDAEQAAAVAG